jgi:predicted ferric reductase
VRDALKGALVGLVLLALVGSIAARLDWIIPSPPRAQSTVAWVFARATGLLAYVALSIDVIVGLLVSTRSAGRVLPRGHLVDLHSWLSPVSLALVLAHAGVLLADGYVRFDVIDILVPFASNRWPVAIGVGTLAAYVLLVVHLSFGLRKRIGAAMWRRLHYLSFAAFLLATIHAIAAGTDRANGWFVFVYVALLVVVVSLVGLRIKRATDTRR